MASKKYGVTWWGNQWLRALENIDYANRIPRGRTYANNGSVLSIAVKDCTIEAQVKGRLIKPYKVKIGIPPFSASDIDKFMDAIAKEPVLVSKLMNNELDSRLDTIASKIGLQIFPSRWDDLDMECSCPDWAVPCKHIAAVIYLMSNEIDNNPFLVFKMHGLDILDEISKRGLAQNLSQSVEIPLLSELYEVTEPQNNDCQEITKTVITNNEPNRRIDFTSLRDISQHLVNLLPDNPSFYRSGNFKATYRGALASLKKRALRIIEGRETLEDATDFSFAPPPLEHNEVQLLINKSLYIDNDISELLGVYNIDDDELTDMHPTVQALNQAIRLAMQLIANGAVVPQMYKIDNGYYSIVWHPAMVDKATSDAVEALDSIMPADLLLLKSPKKRGTPIRIVNQTQILLSYLLSLLIMYLSDDKQDDIYNFIFQQGDNTFDGVGEKSIPGSIHAWLSHFLIGQRKYSPMVVISNEHDSFHISLAVIRDGIPLMLSEILSSKEHSSIRMEVLREILMLKPYITGLEAYIELGANIPIGMSLIDLGNFLMDIVPAMQLLGIKVVLPKELQEIVRPRTSMNLLKRIDSDGVGHVNLAEMLEFDWRVAIGDKSMSAEEFRQLAGIAGGLIKFKGQYIYVDAADLNRLDEALSGRHPVTPGQMLQSALSESFDGTPVLLDNDVRQMISKFTELHEIDVPKQIDATLRPYQKRGFEWMYRNSKLGFGSIIADDMGLGKTLQVITLLQHFKNELKTEKSSNKKKNTGFAIIIVPTTLIANWQAELQRFAPKLGCFVYHGPSRDIANYNTDMLLTTYGVVRSDISILKKIHWHTAIIDEAQNIKNSNSAQSKAVHSIVAENHIAMSGTPIENRLAEFWSIMDFANHGLLGSSTSFKKEYANPIQKWGNAEVAERFRKVTAPFLLRRLKTDRNIIDDLPDKIEENNYATLTESQTALYQKTVDEAMRIIEKSSTSSPQDLFKRQGLVLQMILALKQICNHPSLFLKNGETGLELSGKAEMLMTMLESIIRNKQKVLIFTQFREMGDLLQKYMRDELGENALFLHGGCNVRSRSKMVEEFQTRPECRVFILSIKAAGTGLNLTAASHVIHYDLWWNPAVEAQATDRAYRIGQHQNVIVHRFVTSGTFEEQIDRMIQEKKHLADMTVATGENWIGNLSNEELNEIFRVS